MYMLNANRILFTFYPFFEWRGKKYRIKKRAIKLP